MTTSTVPMPSSSNSEKSQAPELTIINRVASIPIVAYTVQQVSATLANNRYTSSPYSAAKDLSASAYNYAAPLHVRLGPWLVSADNYANKAVDAVETRYPYPFQAKPEEVSSYVRERSASVTKMVGETRENANKAIETRITTPAKEAAYGIDQRLTPLVDYIEKTAVTRLHTSAPTDTQYQVQRVYELSKNVTGQLYDYSHQTVLVQRASQTADSITELAQIAGARVDALSNRLITELRSIQTSLVATGASVQSSAGAASQELNSTIVTLRDILSTPNMPLNEKVNRVGQEVQWRVRPLLDRLLALAPRRQEAANGDASH
ncbi:hypothetical protein MIND_00358500 [Mycena indigotica]|uniref:Lipid droplet-associated perilipin protein n=1 Tax=Mycena indigotica TaxID=2126181 RepID=A0A8H6WEV9_9AGAR|nr:uncharacterized protein MIND_00358500 [Mycena indigotica]KAF7309864.1 hypothetical protein MIND_00358500 [Mycena indigotica]